MVFNFRTFDVEDEFLNNHPGSPPYYGPSCLSFSSSDSSPVCNGCLGGRSGPGLQFSSPVQVQQSQNRRRNGNNFLSKLIYRRSRYRLNRGGELVFFDGCSWSFGLEDLLRARAEMLWKESTWGSSASLEKLRRASDEELGEGSHCSTTYKVSLEDSTTVVVKELKNNGNVTMTQLRDHMKLLGQIRHDNVAPLRGYYISTDKSLMLYDYYSQGSVYSMMHGNKRCALSWKKRWKIMIGAMRGIAYIHNQNGGKLFHGNLTSSNVFVNSQGYGCVSNICCNVLKSGESSYSWYCNPNKGGASQASDIYRLGLLMLELLSAENPFIANAASDIISTGYCDLMDDTFRLSYVDGLLRKECILMVHLALRCATGEADKRPKIKELVEQVENIK